MHVMQLLVVKRDHCAENGKRGRPLGSAQDAVTNQKRPFCSVKDAERGPLAQKTTSRKLKTHRGPRAPHSGPQDTHQNLGTK